MSLSEILVSPSDFRIFKEILTACFSNERVFFVQYEKRGASSKDVEIFSVKFLIENSLSVLDKTPRTLLDIFLEIKDDKTIRFIRLDDCFLNDVFNTVILNLRERLPHEFI